MLVDLNPQELYIAWLALAPYGYDKDAVNARNKIREQYDIALAQAEWENEGGSYNGEA